MVCVVELWVEYLMQYGQVEEIVVVFVLFGVVLKNGRFLIDCVVCGIVDVSQCVIIVIGQVVVIWCVGEVQLDGCVGVWEWIVWMFDFQDRLESGC